MKHVFIANPAAGKCDRSVQLKNLVQDVLGSRGLDFEVQISKAPGDCTRLARQAAESGEEVRLYACGGDGTLNEVINGAAGFSNAAVTHYPCGSGNDFIKLFDHPELFRDLERLLDAEEMPLDLIRCQSGDTVQFSANICSMGLDARIAAEMPRFRRLPLVSGNSAYYLSIAASLRKGISSPFTVDVSGETVSGKQTLICICNGSFYGGSFHPVPEARPDDGMLDVLLIKPINLLQLATVIGKYQAGRYAEFPDLIRSYRTDRIRIRSEEANVVNLDGEIRHARDITFSVEPGALRFFCPRGVQLSSAASQTEPAGAC